MAKKNTAAFLPHEEMMERFRKEGRVHREELSLKALTVDHRLQAREKPLDLDNVKALHAVVKDGLTLAPITVFRIDGKDYVGNGFHRVAVHKKEGLAGILADVVDATWQEAVEFSTCCNMANHALTPTKEDRKKACFMLLDNGWDARSPKEIARHVGVSHTTIVKWRAEWCEKNNRPLPKVVTLWDGRTRQATYRRNEDLHAIKPNSNKIGFRANVGGKEIRLPSGTKEEAAAELQKAIDRRSASLAFYRDSNAVAKFLAYRGVHFGTSKVNWLSGSECRGFAVTYIPEDMRAIHVSVSAGAIVAAVGRAMLIAEHHGLARKVVLVFEPVEGHETIVSLARRLGVEFMTLEQFVEAVKADEGEGGGALAKA